MAGVLLSLRRSMVLRLGVLLGGIVALVLVSMISSIILAEGSVGRGTAINIGGSLRMQAYRVATRYLDTSQRSPEERGELLAREMAVFESRFGASALTAALNESNRRQHQAIERQWQDTRTVVARGLSGELGDQAVMAAMDDLVDNIDALVKELEHATETRLQVLRTIQGVALFMIIGIVIAVMHGVSFSVIAPLRELVDKAQRARNGDFSARVEYDGEDELGELSHTFNTMNSALERRYRDLRRLVAERTARLRRSHRSLSLLYRSYRKMTESGLKLGDMDEIIAELRTLTGLPEIAACLTSDGEGQVHSVVSGGDAAPDFCHNYECGLCRRMRDQTRGITAFAIQIDGSEYGELLVRHEQPLLRWQTSLLRAMADHMAAGLNLDNARDQQRRIVLMEERAVIARELHDSLAQALTYLKIRVSRLQSLLGDDHPEARAATVDLRNGLDSAYRQLRELLKSFRLRLDQSGLGAALNDAASEYGERGDINVTVEDQLSHCPLHSGEEVHVLQIVREALANVVQHAQASRAEVRLMYVDRDHVEVSIDDDGRGMQPNHQSGHFGTRIMQERAASLGGEVEFQASPLGGTRVFLSFTPGFVRRPGEHLIAESSS